MPVHSALYFGICRWLKYHILLFFFSLHLVSVGNKSLSMGNLTKAVGVQIEVYDSGQESTYASLVGCYR